ncbi:MAG: hypothetical protein M1819_006743 [Sarea resinae]|nr:MAG: hypothetical protein M1819_006743 [Sarea resinae]
MTLLDTHLEQISLCATAISELPFPPPKIFTNALLHPHDITALIRDTEAHERALFSVPPPPPPPKAQDPSISTARRNTIFNPNGGTESIGGGGINAVRAPRRNTAVAAVLGGELVEQIRQGGGGGIGSGLGYGGMESRERGEVNVEVLLRGAEKLCGVPIPGAAERISSLRGRYQQLTSSLTEYEARVAKQAAQLERMNRPKAYDGDDDFDDDEALDVPVGVENVEFTEEELRSEEEEIRQLEKRKRGLEERVSGMEKDMGGLLR